MTTLLLTDATFEAQVTDSALPVVVSFGAEWSAAARRMVREMEALAAAGAAGVTLARVDIDQSPATSRKFGIRAVPTTLLFSGGAPKSRTTDALSAAQLAAWMKS